MNTWRFFGAAALVAGVCMTALAQDQNQSPQATNSGAQAAVLSGSMNNHGGAITTAEQQFVSEAAQGDRAEVDLANLALQKSSNPDVKQFAQRIVDDHTQNQQQVDSLASKLNITPPSDVSAEQKENIDGLQTLSGDQFDRAYARLMLHEHRKDVSEFSRERQMAKNSDLKRYVAQTLPVLEQHLQLASQLNSRVAREGF